MYETIIEFLPFLIPFMIIQGGLWIAALIHILKSNSYRFGNRPMWIIISFLAIIGPVLYFIIGRSESAGNV